MKNAMQQEMKRVRAEARQLFSLQQVDDAIRNLAIAISRDYAERDPLLITIMNGGVVLAGRLLPLLDFPLQVDYLHASRYLGETQGGDKVSWIVTPRQSLAGRDVIILDDILDVGTTLLAIIEACKTQGAASVAAAVLVDKHHDRKATPGLKADYTALEVEDAYVFGCGMDYKHYWRNAPGIFAVTETIAES
jgi:hypoxanthine phosphoribosyltransferase